jgi:hypothetical protein
MLGLRTLSINRLAAAVQEALQTISATTDKFTSFLLKAAGVQGATSASFEDSSSNNFPITRSGNATESSLSPFSTTSWSTYFDGNGDYLSLPSSSAFNQNTTFTVECWVYPALSTSRYIFAQLTSGYLCLSHSNNSFHIDKSSVGIQFTTSANYPPNSWYHIVMCYDGSRTYLYINGLLQGSISGGGVASSTTFTIGSYLTGTNHFTGYISNFRIVRGLSVMIHLQPILKFQQLL